MDLISPEQLEKDKQREENVKNSAAEDVIWALGRAEEIVDNEEQRLALGSSVSLRKQCVAEMLLKAYYQKLDHWINQFH